MGSNSHGRGRSTTRKKTLNSTARKKIKSSIGRRSKRHPSPFQYSSGGDSRSSSLESRDGKRVPRSSRDTSRGSIRDGSVRGSGSGEKQPTRTRLRNKKKKDSGVGKKKKKKTTETDQLPPPAPQSNTNDRIRLPDKEDASSLLESAAFENVPMNHGSIEDSVKGLQYSINQTSIVTSTKLHAAMVRLFEHQNNMEQSQERYQDQFVHRDVDVITAGLSKDPIELKSLWQVDGSLEAEPITHGLLKSVWNAASENTRLTMNIHEFEAVVRNFIRESRIQSVKQLDLQLKMSMQGMRQIFETSLSREERKDEFAKQNADEIQHRIKQAAIWIEWQKENILHTINSAFRLFEDAMDKLIVGVLNFFDDQRGKLLSKKNTKITHCICIREPNNSVAEPDEIGKYTFAVTSFDNKSKRAIVTYADPNRVPRVESLQLLLARVDIQNILKSTISNGNKTPSYLM